MDPVTIALFAQLGTQVMRLIADHMELAATGVHTPEQSKAIAEHLRTHIDALQAMLPKP